VLKPGDMQGHDDIHGLVMMGIVLELVLGCLLFTGCSDKPAFGKQLDVDSEL
jgi:hypothetical protein